VKQFRGNFQYSKANLSSCRRGLLRLRKALKQRTIIGLAAFAFFACAGLAHGQAPAKKAESDVGETYNPLLAEKDLEVGLYYFKTKSYDAAIERLKACLVHRPNYAKPRWYLAQSYEKKGEWAEAIQYYREYVEILPDTKEGKQAASKIVELTRKLEEKKPRRK